MIKKLSGKILVAILLLLAIAAAALHIIVRHTEIPRQIAENSLREKLKTDVSIEHLETGWLGRSRLKNIRIQLPTDKPGYLTIKSLRVRHNILPILLISLGPRTVNADNVTLHLPQDASTPDPEPKTIPLGDMEFTFYHNKADKAVAEDAKLIKTVITRPDIGQIKTLTLIEDKQVNLNIIDGNLFYGEFSGRLKFHLDQWEKTCVDLTWQNIDLKKLKKWYPQVEDLLNRCSGRLEIKPAEREHPFEPLAYHTEIMMKGESILNKLNIDKLQMSGAVGLKRILLTDFNLPIFGGTFKSNVRLSKKTEGFFLYSKCDFQQIDIERIADTFSKDKNDEQIQGKLQGNITAMTSFKIRDLSGTMDMKLTDSNLAQSQFMQALSDILNLSFRKSAPLGYGSTKLSFQGPEITISDLYYYNRGIEIRGTGLINDFLQAGQSPVQGLVMATARPLKELKLPGTGTLDKYLYLIQRDMTAIKVEGTLEETKVKVIALPEVKKTLNKILNGSKN